MSVIKRALTAVAAVLVAGLATVSMAERSGAATLFQSIPDLTIEPSSNAWCSTCFGSYGAYDAFSLASSSSVSAIHFDVQTDYGFPASSITVNIFSANGNQAGSQLFSQTFLNSDYSFVNNPFDTSLVTVAPSGLHLAAGDYFIEFLNLANLGVPGYDNPGGKLYQSNDPFSTAIDISHAGQSAGFALEGVNAVPLPGSVGLFFVGLAGLTGIGAISRRAGLARG